MILAIGYLITFIAFVAYNVYRDNTFGNNYR
jgi:hypothetical protein